MNCCCPLARVRGFPFHPRRASLSNVHHAPNSPFPSPLLTRNHTALLKRGGPTSLHPLRWSSPKGTSFPLYEAFPRERVLYSDPPHLSVTPIPGRESTPITVRLLPLPVLRPAATPFIPDEILLFFTPPPLPPAPSFSFPFVTRFFSAQQLAAPSRSPQTSHSSIYRLDLMKCVVF